MDGGEGIFPPSKFFFTFNSFIMPKIDTTKNFSKYISSRSKAINFVEKMLEEGERLDYAAIGHRKRGRFIPFLTWGGQQNFVWEYVSTTKKLIVYYKNKK